MKRPWSDWVGMVSSQAEHCNVLDLMVACRRGTDEGGGRRGGRLRCDGPYNMIDGGTFWSVVQRKE